jgi:trans-aconitate methyltransferase
VSVDTDGRLVEHWDGHDYERQSAHQRAWGRGLIDELRFRGHERILDLGCGDGSLTRQLAERVPNGWVLGVDAAPEMLEAAEAKRLPNTTLRCLNIDALTSAGEFDLVFSNAALHWVHDHATLLVNVYRALRPGGVLRAQFGGGANCPNLVACVRRQMTAPPYAEALRSFRWPWRFFSVPEYERLLRVSSFAEWRTWLEERDHAFPTTDALVGWIDNPCLIPFLQALPAALRKPFRTAVVEAMLHATRRSDGVCVEQFRRLNVWARRSE